MSQFTDALAEDARAVTETLNRLLSTEDSAEARLTEAMRYATLNGGKRVRPFLVMSSARLFNVADPAPSG